MTTRTTYEVNAHAHGCPLVQRGPAAGCRNFPQHRWMRITPRPIGIARARRLADEQPFHAVVTPWETAGVVYDNGKPPEVPEGWTPARSTV